VKVQENWKLLCVGGEIEERKGGVQMVRFYPLQFATIVVILEVV